MIWLLRHGEAADGLPDDERPLTERGSRQAEDAGRALERLGVQIDACLSSPKLRAVQTAELACAPIGAEVNVERRLAGEPIDVHELVAGLGEVLLVGHDPSFSMTLHDLTGVQARMRKGGLAAIEKGELIVLLRPSELSAIAAGRESPMIEHPSESSGDGRASNGTAGREPASAGGLGGGIATAPAVAPTDLRDSSLYVNRELSWLDFNDRVLQLAEDESLPLIERVKFLAIFVTNLDEFFMVRVAGVHDQVDARIDARGPDGLAPTEVLKRIAEKVHELDRRHAVQWSERVRPALAANGIRVTTIEGSGAPAGDIERHFREQIFPVLTPLAVGPGRPFPYISNLSLSLIVRLHDPDLDHEAFARVKVPKEVLPRFVEIRKDTFIPLEDIIAHHLDALFPGMDILSYDLFRVTRDADFDVSDEADDLLQAVEDELRRRRFGEVVRLEVGAGMDPALRSRLIEWLGVDEVQVYDVEGQLDLGDLWQIASVDSRPGLRWPSWTPVIQTGLGSGTGNGGASDMFRAMRAGDVLVHYPYQSFSSSVERFVKQAVDDPDVLAIKMTVYRTSDDSALVPSLIEAAEKGKQAVCLVELTARFDERQNIHWSRALEEVGAHVVHGLPGLKTHAKAILIVRRERTGVRHYLMVGTGNFHAKNARLYEDFGLFTTDRELGEEVANLFNTLTGYGHSQPQRNALVAPTWMREPLLTQIDRTIAAHEAGVPCRIVMKMNSLVDQGMIEALYRASQAGVPIELNVRGICCLIPGLPGISETINVVSVVGRFLEHSRIYAFHRGEERLYYIGSADLMPRNLDTRVELLVPIERPELQAELDDTLERCLVDDTNAWTMDSDTSWTRRHGNTRSVHRELMERTLTWAAGFAT